MTSRKPQASDQAQCGSAVRLVALVGAVMMMVAAAIFMWTPYAAVVFFETVRAGFIACFG